MSVQDLINELNLVPEALRASVTVIIDWDYAIDCMFLDDKKEKRFLIES